METRIVTQIVKLMDRMHIRRDHNTLDLTDMDILGDLEYGRDEVTDADPPQRPSHGDPVIAR